MSRDLLNPETVFAQAIEIDSPEDRAAFLDQACGNDPELRREVENLVVDHFRAGKFLENPAARIVATGDEQPVSEGPGTQIGPYKLLEQIGEGGFGVVFMAEQHHPVRRKVALKVIKPGMDSRAVIARFEAERQALALMDHPNIAHVFDGGETPTGRPYFVMELVRGIPITDYCDQAQFTPMERLELFVHVCQAVQHAHQKGIIHRDLKPSNVLVTLHDGTPVPKIIDFGIAKAMGQQLTDKTLFTNFAQMVGTPLYMSPEQAALSGLDADTRTDIYSLGVLLYELLTGTPPFDKERFSKISYDEIRRIIREEEPPKPSTRISTLGRSGLPSRTDPAPQAGPTGAETTTLATIAAQRKTDPQRLGQLFRGELDWIVMKALDKDRNRRYETANSFALDIQRYLHDEAVLACPPSAWYRFSKFVRRHKTAVLAASLVLLTLTGGAVGTTVGLIQADLGRQAAETAGANERAERRRAENAELDAKHKLWLSYLRQAQARRMSRQSGQRMASLRAIKDALALPVPPGHSRDELRTEAISALCLPDLELVRELGSDTIGSSGFAIDPAFQRYAVGDKDGKISIRRVSDNQELLQLRGGGGPVDNYGGLQFSPDGRFLHQRCQIPQGWRSRLWRLDRPEPKAVLEDNATSLAFRPDGGEVAAAYPDRTVRFFDTESARELHRFEVPGMPPACHLSWNPQLPQLILCARTALRLLNVDTGAAAEVGPHVPGEYYCAAWHPKGRLLALSIDYKIYLWDVSARCLTLPPLEGHKHLGVQVFFNHAGDRLLSTDWSASWHLWDTHSGQLLLTLPALGVEPYFSPDDSLVGAGERGKVQLYHFRRGKELRTLVLPNRTSQIRIQVPPVLGPEGPFFASVVENGVVLVDVARGEEAGLLPLPGNSPLCFEPAGTLWTHGSQGLLRWPATVDDKTGQRRYGPPERMFAATNWWDRLGSTPDAHVIAIPQGPTHAGAIIFHRDGNRQVRLGPQQDVRCCAVSPDGRWVAAGSSALHEGAGAKVWDAAAGKHIKDLPVGGSCAVQFSPDGKWLLTTSGGPRLWAVGTWEEGPKLGGTSLNPWGAFSHDSKLLALGDEPGVVRLVALETGVELARLTAPEQARLEPCCITPDGTQLITVGSENRELYIFNLRAIRAGLAELDLDWEAPPLPAVAARPAPPLAIQFDLGDVPKWSDAKKLLEQADHHARAKEHTEAVADYSKAIKLDPQNAASLNNLAWLLANCSDLKLRDPGRAVALAKKAVELMPEKWAYWNTLGAAHNRAGGWKAAVAALEKSMELRKGGDSFDWFFLAMACWHLEKKQEARKWYDQAVQWMEKNQPKNEDLLRFRAEAAELLQVKITEQ
jgi:serine/threonine protein kinase/WD40 repeat protein